MTRERRSDLAWSALIAFVILGPIVVERGFALRGDMVFVPRQPWKDAWLGLDGAAPRFVPGDALLSLATSIVPGDVLQKVLLVAALVLGGLGAGRLVATHAFASRAAVILFFLWNPWVYERLAIGQWGFVVGYAVLPWAAMAARTVRDDVRRGWPAVVLALGTGAMFSPPAALMVAATVLCVVLTRPRWHTTLTVVAATILVNLPWLVPSLLRAGDLSSDAGQFAAFAARGESAVGLLPSALSLGGIWKTSVVPPERMLWLVVILSCATTLVSIAALLRARWEDRAFISGLAILASGSVLLAVLPALPSVAELLDQMAASFPALGLLRDSHRYLAPAVLVLLPGLAAAMTWLRAQATSGREAVYALAMLLAVLPALALPSMGWGLGGALRPVHYPEEWTRLAQRMPAETTVVLPWRGTYRGFSWNDHRAMLDPAPRFFPGEVIIDDRHYLDAAQLGHEDPRLAEITAALAAPDPTRGLRDLGVRQVLLEKGNGVAVRDVPAGQILHDGPGLMLVDLGPTSTPWGGQEPSRWPVVLANALAAATYLAALAALGRGTVYGSGNFGERKQEES